MVLIGTTAGGGYDAYGRLLVRHLGRQLPGHPTIIVKNMRKTARESAAGAAPEAHA